MTGNKFTCGSCVNNEDGFCDYIGVMVEDDDSPHCAYGKGWTSFESFKKKEDKESQKKHAV